MGLLSLLTLRPMGACCSCGHVFCCTRIQNRGNGNVVTINLPPSLPGEKEAASKSPEITRLGQPRRGEKIDEFKRKLMGMMIEGPEEKERRLITAQILASVNLETIKNEIQAKVRKNIPWLLKRRLTRTTLFVNSWGSAAAFLWNEIKTRIAQGQTFTPYNTNLSLREFCLLDGYMKRNTIKISEIFHIASCFAEVDDRIKLIFLKIVKKRASGEIFNCKRRVLQPSLSWLSGSLTTSARLAQRERLHQGLSR